MPMRREFHTFKCLFHTEYTKIFCESNDKTLYLQKERTREHTIRTTTLYLQQN